MNDFEYMRFALSLAERGTALASPGAMVGAIVVKNDRIIGEGFYTYDGIKHAEILALEQAKGEAKGATIYTSLEPCSHQDRTGPCAQALIEAGIKRVVTATTDLNPVVNGRGIAMLRAAGIDTHVGLMEEDARRLNESFITYKTQQRPFGILKLAMTLDGKIATSSGESKWITNEASRLAVHDLRHRADAVITGSGTFLKDKPQLTDRTGRQRRRPLLRVVLDRRGRVGRPDGFLIHAGSLSDLARELYRHEIQSFLLECGPDLAFTALESGIIDKIVAFVAPTILGGRDTLSIAGNGVAKLADAIQLRDLSCQKLGPDLLISGYVHRNH